MLRPHGDTGPGAWGDRGRGESHPVPITVQLLSISEKVAPGLHIHKLGLSNVRPPGKLINTASSEVPERGQQRGECCFRRSSHQQLGKEKIMFSSGAKSVRSHCKKPEGFQVPQAFPQVFSGLCSVTLLLGRR